jgi:ATP adenylyltransferase/5',5'''-P-1,P-4-tetraphosphate phosphorylase II
MTPRTLDPLNLTLINNMLYARFDGVESTTSLSAHCLELLSEQKESWQKLKDAYGALRTLRTRSMDLNGFSVRLYCNPGRLASAVAAVGQKDIKDRPCFLCIQNLPSEQKGIFYREEYMILCNPMPVFPSHLTIAHVEHRPQAISEDFDAFLTLMADLGEGWIALYNGPRCGASAPDHLHFQALPAGHMPVEQKILEGAGFMLAAQIEDVFVYRSRDMGREIIVLEGDKRVSMVHAFTKILAALKKVVSAQDEPMVNVAGFFKKVGSEGFLNMGKWRVLIFPRQKHRPDSYFKEGGDRIVVSPGVVEMAGILITPLERDFERLDAASVEGIYQEVSLDGNILTKAIENMA